MNVFKKVKVVMLPATEQTGQVGRGAMFINDSREHSWGKLQALECERITRHGHAWNGNGLRTYINHLYFLSDDETKEGDWYWSLLENKPFLYTKERCVTQKWHVEGTSLKFDQKIIATTDKSLQVNDSFDVLSIQAGKVLYSTKSLPQPSQDFIKEYCDKNGIDEVMVEYELKNTLFGDDQYERLKVASDNTITIKSIKDSWNREEVEALCKKAFQIQRGYGTLADFYKENL